MCSNTTRISKPEQIEQEKEEIEMSSMPPVCRTEFPHVTELMSTGTESCSTCLQVRCHSADSVIWYCSDICSNLLCRFWPALKPPGHCKVEDHCRWIKYTQHAQIIYNPNLFRPDRQPCIIIHVLVQLKFLCK